ncbi:MAG: DNA translocase FtsK 4TM domain-containing protein [Bryobacterales bacterium]|nr:DNA translocase FtsK 4TM domain-containing protein [Bryobacterales bacterium]MEB2361277.1 DNA translocase FtsK 4TM domain-containing protein [Bryobacterales bacterium]
MRLLGPTEHPRLNEAIGLVFLFASVLLTLSLVSFHPQDPSWNTATGPVKPQNLIGYPGAHISDFLLQVFGVPAFLLPVLLLVLSWRWLLSRRIEAPFAKVAGAVLFLTSAAGLLSLGPDWRMFGNTVAPGGLAGTLLAACLLDNLNQTGAILVAGMSLVFSLYFVSTFSMRHVVRLLRGPAGAWRSLIERWGAWRVQRRALRAEKARRKAELKAAAKAERKARRQKPGPAAGPLHLSSTPEGDAPPWDEESSSRTYPEEPEEEVEPEEHDIPIRPLEEPAVSAHAGAAPAEFAPAARPVVEHLPERKQYELPPTSLLNEPAARNPYDSQELKDIAVRIKSKFEEFNVLGSVVQINPGPVVTTFEFKPEAGIKYSRITTLTEDLCLGLQAESILIERIPGKPTVGIEVPNSKREVISLRQVLESEEFHNSPSRLTISLGKDINGRIKVTALESMPHLLIAGSTGSGKSVMLNSMIMSILYKSTPDEVRLIMVDPKRVELGIYEGIPHLLTPVITDAKKATNALRNAVLEMERRLKLLAAQGVRNIDQYNRKMKQLAEQPRKLFEDDGAEPEDLRPLPFILIIIDELADLMMVERGAVEETVTRLAQMARAVGMHLVLATQRPSVDVITGLIKANFPARISFRVATRVDSRTILDVMGAEHLLGKGDMLILPPGSSRLVRVHGAYVSESETNRVVEFWKSQAQPKYDRTFLIAPPADDEEEEPSGLDDAEDPMYQDAVRVVLEMGKASTSTLQRRLRLGYGRAARILDMMQRDGIIGPPDGSRPRDVLKRPDWLEEVENQAR